MSAIAIVAWIALRILVHVLYSHNGVALVSGWGQFRYLLPWHLPQIFSTLGFFPIPVLLSRSRLPAMHQRGVVIASLIILVVFYFAVWSETRAWSEWSTAFAVWAAMEFTGTGTARNGKIGSVVGDSFVMHSSRSQMRQE